MKTIKEYLLDHCTAYVGQRIDTARQAIEASQASANDETKSSAGDKYETGRARMQLEIEKNSVQFAEALKLRQALEKIRTDIGSPPAVQEGSLVITNESNFFIAISVGKVVLQNKTYFIVSPGSPVGRQLMNKKTGDVISFGAAKYTILQIV